MYAATEQRQFTARAKEVLKLVDTFKTKDAKEQVAELKKILVFHEWRYYVKNDPTISDYEYDQLYKLLESVEANNPHLITKDSPTQRVANDLTDSFDSVEHLIPMLSLDNSYNAEDLNDFDTQVKKFGLIDEKEDLSYVVEPKFDGGSIALIYENDYLIRAATRGNGIAGEEMTANARVMHSVPLKAAFSKFGIHKVELRGEVLIRKDVFNKMNEQRIALGESPFANPRNAATGGLRMKDPKEASQRGLVAFVYTLGYAVDDQGNNMLDKFPTHDESIEALGQLGFKVPHAAKKVCKNIQEVIDYCLSWEEKREEYPYEVDGMVVKVNDRNLQERAGSTSHHPRWAIAFKFKAKQATTKLLRVDFQVGKVGAITPVAKLEPVALAGVTISSVSLHNEDFIRDKDIRIGDTVLVERAGDVIPYIVKSMAELRDGTESVLEYPSACPVCSSPLARLENEAAWRCENYDCEAQIIQRLIHHVSKNAMDIEGLGESSIERFFKEDLIHSLADIYKLDYDFIAQMEGFGQKSANKLKDAIENAKQNPIRRFLYGLSIHHVGRKVSKLLAAEIKHVLDLKDWTMENFTEIHDIGPKVAENVIAFFANEKNIHLMEEMEKLGVNLSQTSEDIPKAVASDAPLAGKTILFTGKLEQMSRKEAQEKAEAAGAKNISAVSSNLNILVAGEKAGSKLKKAQALGTVEIMTEEEFIALIA